ncbi:hypothetical protein LXL04_006721 [Taraxacum kok-saghyz]
MVQENIDILIESQVRLIVKMIKEFHEDVALQRSCFVYVLLSLYLNMLLDIVEIGNAKSTAPNFNKGGEFPNQVLWSTDRSVDCGSQIMATPVIRSCGLTDKRGWLPGWVPPSVACSAKSGNVASNQEIARLALLTALELAALSPKGIELTCGPVECAAVRHCRRRGETKSLPAISDLRECDRDNDAVRSTCESEFECSTLTVLLVEEEERKNGGHKRFHCRRGEQKWRQKTVPLQMR